MDAHAARAVRAAGAGRHAIATSSSTPRFTDQTFKHILAPVWLLTYVYGARSYQVVVNGVTGRIAGSRPWSWIKVTLVILLAVIVFLFFVYLNNS